MIRWLIAASTLLMLGVATPALADDISDCTESANPDLSIRACTSLIQSGNAKGDDLANAYFNRGVVFGRDRGDLDQAIADYDKAIELDPDDADGPR